MRNILTYIFFISSSISLLASSTKADSLYTVQNYREAIAEYEKQLSEGVNDNIYYNIGNCHFRMSEYPQAILNYHKALKINPQHSDARDNLRICSDKVGAYEQSNNEMFYTTWIKTLVSSKSANDWGFWALCCWIVFLFIGVAYFLAQTPKVKKITFFTALPLLILTILLNIFAYNSKQDFYNTLHLVVMKSTPLYESATTASKQIGEVTPGVLLKLNDSFEGHWYNVNLPDGRQAWCENTTVEKVELN